MPLKYSKQRQAIWDYLRDSDAHPTADMVYLHVRKEYPNISLGTVYRNLVLLRDLGQLGTVDIGDGVVRYDPHVEEHDHFVCTKCGAVTDIGTDPSEHIRMVRNADGLFAGTVTGCRVLYSGICSSCMQISDSDKT